MNALPQSNNQPNKTLVSKKGHTHRKTISLLNNRTDIATHGFDLAIIMSDISLTISFLQVIKTIKAES